MIRKITTLLLFLLLLPDLFAQNSDTIPNYHLKLEKRHAGMKEYVQLYLDTAPDTLFYKNQRYFFRHTPLSLKSGYTHIFNQEDGVHFFDHVFGGSLNGYKGYIVTWGIRNDSLFLQNVNPQYLGNHSVMHPDGSHEYVEMLPLAADTLRSRMEKFTGSRFREDLLFVDWITGEFGIIESYRQKFPFDPQTGEYNDGREKGWVLSIENGIIKGMREDNREQKN